MGFWCVVGSGVDWDGLLVGDLVVEVGKLVGVFGCVL